MTDDTTFDGIRPGIYNVDYFSSSQVALYIADIFVDEVTSLNFVVQQNRRPLYGYADQYFRQVSKGQVIVQGQFTINFKEAGYLWLILNNYKQMMGFADKLNPWTDSQNQMKQNIESLVNGYSPPQERTDAFTTLADVYASLAGFSSTERAAAAKNEEGRTMLGEAEDIFEVFEDHIWGNPVKTIHGYDVSDNRRADDVDLNPFDMYISYGDFAGDNRANHTIIKLEDVYILGTSQNIEIDGAPIQEAYSFIAKTRI